MISIGWSVATLIVAVVALVVWRSKTTRAKEERDPNIAEVASYFLFGFIGSLVLAVLLFALASTVTIKPGHAGVARLFGNVQKEHKEPGLHFANPFLDWEQYDCREKTYMTSAQVPSMDQLMTKFDVSVQYRLVPKMTPKILNETGTSRQMVTIHLVPKLRSLMREIGKTVRRAEDFFQPETQSRLQKLLLTKLRGYLAKRGMRIKAVLIRDIQLPETIRLGVLAKKKRDQAAEKEKSELRRFQTEQQKKVARAEAQLQAARKDAERRKVREMARAVAQLEAAKKDATKKRVLADAKAYEILQINKAVANNAAYIQLEALKALRSMGSDPAAKLYFLDGKSTMPVPLINVGTKRLR